MLLDAQCSANLPLKVMKAAILPHDIPAKTKKRCHISKSSAETFAEQIFSLSTIQTGNQQNGWKPTKSVKQFVSAYLSALWKGDFQGSYNFQFFSELLLNWEFYMVSPKIIFTYPLHNAKLQVLLRGTLDAIFFLKALNVFLGDSLTPP